jgi:hypothetical protein
MSAQDLTGRTFADLRVIKRDHARKAKAAYWTVACRCGSSPFSVRSDSLLQGRTTRCVACAHRGAHIVFVIADTAPSNSVMRSSDAGAACFA